MSKKQLEIKITLDNPYKLVSILLLIVVMVLVGMQFKIGAVNLINKEIVQQACIETEDCTPGWGCKRSDPRQLVGKCVDIEQN